MSIGIVKNQFSYDDFMKEKSEKDANFIDPEEEYKQQKEAEEQEKMSLDGLSESSEVSVDRKDYEASQAMELYKMAQQEILHL